MATNFIPNYRTLDPLPLEWYKAAVALPSVYDDSLSYMEVLARVTAMLNRVIEQMNTEGENTDELAEAFEKLQDYVNDYFENLDVNSEVQETTEKAFNAIVDDGTVSAILTPILSHYFNPVFVSSTSDMKDTKYVYALNTDNNPDNYMLYSYENNAYAPSGYYFGGYVSSVTEMLNHDYAYSYKETNKMWYWNRNTQKWEESIALFGGIVKSTADMLPTNRIYVLTTNAHVYAWNGTAFADTGVVYGLSNTSFVERSLLSTSNDLLSLTESGWYYYEANKLPKKNAPPVLDNYPGVIIHYNSPFPFSILYAQNGACFISLNKNWINLSLTGTTPPKNADNAISNTVTLVDPESCTNLPKTNVRGALLTFTHEQYTFQIFENTELWFRNRLNDWTQWIKICNESEMLSYITRLTEQFNTQITNIEAKTTESLIKAESALEILHEISYPSDKSLMAENFQAITTENSASLFINSYALKTDGTLSKYGTPADAAAVGRSISAMNNVITATDNRLTNIVDETNSAVALLSSAVSTISPFSLATESYSPVSAESGDSLAAAVPTPRTDKSLSQDFIPADAAAVGNAVSSLQNSITSTTNDLNTVSNNLSSTTNALTLLSSTVSSISPFPLVTESYSPVSAESGDSLAAAVPTPRTDKSLSQDFIPADAAAVGNAVSSLQNSIASATNDLNTVSNNLSNTTNALTLLSSAVSTVSPFSLASESSSPVSAESGDSLAAAVPTPRTDKSLSQDFIPADAAAVGEIFNKITPAPWESYSLITATSHSYNVPLVYLYGTPPETKDYVTMNCKIVINNIPIYNANCSVKLQGSSSLRNPEKNYTIKLSNNITMFGYTLSKWVIKCNWTDPSQCRNIVGARTYKRLLEQILPPAESYTLTTENNSPLATENNAALNGYGYLSKLQNSPHWGTSDGEIIYVALNDEFHGVYTMQIPKDEKMFNMIEKSNEFFVSLSNWDFTPFSSVSSMLSKIEVEYATADMTDEVIFNQLNRFANWLKNVTAETFIETAEQYTNLDICLAYLCFCFWTVNRDGEIRNMNLYSYDGGNHINISAYDMDSTSGWSSSGFAIQVAGTMAGYTGGFTTADSITSSLNNNPINIIKNRNALFNKIITLIPQHFKAAWNNYRQTTLNARATLADYSSMLNYSSKEMFNRDFAKWPNKPKTNLADNIYPAIFSLLNGERLDSFINNL